MSLKAMLGDAIENGFDKLDEMKVGSDEYRTTVEQLTKMTDRVIEIEKVENDVSNQNKSREIEEKTRLQQIKHDQIDRYIKHGLTAVSIVGGLVLTVWGAKASWRFEETGTITSTAGRKFINNLFFKK